MSGGTSQCTVCGEVYDDASACRCTDKPAPREWSGYKTPEGLRAGGNYGCTDGWEYTTFVETSAYLALAKENAELRAEVAAEKERADKWYEKFAKLEIERASCCVQMEEERDQDCKHALRLAAIARNST